MGVKLPTDLPSLLKQLRAEDVSDFEVEGDVVRVRFFERHAAGDQKTAEKKPPRKLAAVAALKGFDIDPNRFE